MKIQIIGTCISICISAVIPLEKLYILAEDTSDCNFESKCFYLRVLVICFNAWFCPRRKITRKNDEIWFDITNTISVWI